MAEVTATTERVIDEPAEQVTAALADYEQTRPRILTEHFSDYRVEAGGQGAGTTVHWRLAATQKRVRDQLIDVNAPAEGTLEERDRNSSMVTTWRVTPAGDQRSTVAVESRWTGAGGVAGFFERTFAPQGLRRIYDGVLANLASSVGERPS